LGKSIYLSAYSRQGQSFPGRKGLRPQIETDLYARNAEHWIIFDPANSADLRLAHPGCHNCLVLTSFMNRRK